MNPSTFKRLAIGQTFVSLHPDSKGRTFRKVSQSGAFAIVPATDKLRPNRGQTHGQVRFARSTAVTVPLRIASAARDGVTAEA